MAAPDFQPNADPPRSPSIITGVKGVTNLVTGRLVQEIDEDIAFVEPSATPVTTALILVQKKMKSVGNRKFEWIEVDAENGNGTVAATIAAGDTTFVLGAGEGARFKAYDLVRINETGEVALITSMSTDTPTVTRGVGSSGSGSATTAATTITRIANAAEEGADVGTLKSIQESIPYNYIQTFRRAFGLTWDEQSSDLHGGRDPEVEKKKQLIEFKKEIDRSIMFGRRDLLTGSGGQERPISGGFDYFIQTNLWDLGGNVPSEIQFINTLGYVMQYGKNGYREGSARKLLIASPNWITLFNKFGLEKVSYDLGQAFGTKKIGINATIYQTAHGEVMLLRHPMLTGAHAGTAYLIDPGEVELMYHQGGGNAPDGRPKLLDGRGGNGVTADTFEYYARLGLKLKLEMAHAKFTNLGSIV